MSFYSVFWPDAVFHRITSVTPQYLQQHNIRAIVLDIDNTLTAHDSQHLSPAVEQWLVQRKAEGIRFAVSSNNGEERVAPFAEKIGVQWVSKAKKPARSGFKRAQALLGVPKEQMALIGDQLFTDVLGARLYGIHAIRVEPMAPDIKWFILFKRKLEKPFIHSYQKHGGCYYE